MIILYLIVITYIIFKIKTRNKAFFFSLFNFKVREFHYQKNNQNIVLLGMSHVANEKFYNHISSNYKNLLVLEEGIQSNEKKKNTAMYQELAKIFGIKAQRIDLFKNHKSQNADIHINDFPSDLRKFFISLKNILIALEKKDSKQLALNFLEFKESSDKNKDLNEEFILNKRNENLYKHILSKNEDLLVPWGAKHLNEIRQWLKRDGYVVKKKKTYNAINLWISSFYLIKYLIKNKKFIKETYKEIELLMDNKNEAKDLCKN